VVLAVAFVWRLTVRRFTLLADVPGEFQAVVLLTVLWLVQVIAAFRSGQRRRLSALPTAGMPLQKMSGTSRGGSEVVQGDRQTFQARPVLVPPAPRLRLSVQQRCRHGQRSVARLVDSVGGATVRVPVSNRLSAASSE
jgi:hypothetical protein